jgi:hypothetical protein
MTLARLTILTCARHPRNPAFLRIAIMGHQLVNADAYALSGVDAGTCRTWRLAVM